MVPAFVLFRLRSNFRWLSEDMCQVVDNKQTDFLSARLWTGNLMFAECRLYWKTLSSETQTASAFVSGNGYFSGFQLLLNFW